MNPINFRATDEELAQLKNYCKIKKRQQNEVLRELLRKLSIERGVEPHRLTACPSRHQPEYKYSVGIPACLAKSVRNKR